MEEPKAPDASPSEEWAGLPWRKLEQHQYRLQQRIAESLPTWRSANRSPATEIVNEVPVSPTSGRSTSDPGQSGQENRRYRWSEIRPTSGQMGHG